MLQQSSGETHITTIASEPRKLFNPLLAIKIVDRFRRLPDDLSIVRIDGLLHGAIENAGIDIAVTQMANIRHLADLLNMLPHLFARHVIFSAEVNGSVVIDVSTEQRGRVGLAVVKTAFNAPVR